MRAMVIDQFGGPEVFQAREMDRPEAGPGELLVRVICAGTNPVDAKMRQNADWAGLAPPLVLGQDASGIVESVGPGVTGFSPGDEVYYMDELFGNTMGTYAEYNAVPARLVAHKPPSLSHEQAAAVPLAGGTAWEAIVRRMQVRPGETVLIHGGAGGVGSFAVQFAKAAGARVLATAGARNQDVIRQLGADVAIDYSAEDFAEVALRETGGKGVDATFDTVGGDLIRRSLPATRPFGRLACILTPEGTLGGLSSRNQTLHGIFVMREAERLRDMSAAFEQGLARPLIGEVMPLEQVSRAHERLDSGHGTGKLILRVAEG
ncbi:zinc-dependent alcohol dehydrogenase family protein [Longimicrobium terrae]|nr:zinc-dependent alcohol dehydrogenase family protein [Longimicrobium terrae]